MKPVDYAFAFLIMAFTFAGVLVFFRLEPSVLHLALSSIITVAVTYYVFMIRRKRAEADK